MSISCYMNIFKLSDGQCEGTICSKSLFSQINLKIHRNSDYVGFHNKSRTINFVHLPIKIDLTKLPISIIHDCKKTNPSPLLLDGEFNWNKLKNQLGHKPFFRKVRTKVLQICMSVQSKILYNHYRVFFFPDSTIIKE